MTVVGRFAPSPTGPLHLGSLRTALVAWLFARSTGGRFLLRIEDLDPQRSRPEFEAQQLAQLTALGIGWDGEVVRQSARGALYEQAIARLADHLYPCFCTRAEIREAASAPHGDLPEGAYPGTCRGLGAAERGRRIEAGERYALRFAAGGEVVMFDDELAGSQSFAADDFVVRRADGIVGYQLAVVVDDSEQGINQVVRGADLLDSSARQILLQRALELPTPAYAHVPLVLGPDGERLAKRYGTVPTEDPLAWLASSLGIEAGSPARAADLLGDFDPASIPKTPVSV
jgi:glutamyl-tRNA synthetase